MFNINDWKREADIVADVLKRAPSFDKEFRIGKEEFIERWRKTWTDMEAQGIDVGFVYSDEHYCGDVPYFGGNTNIHVEPVAGLVGKNGFFLLAGLEGGYCAEQLSWRSGCQVRKVEMLKLADEDYPVEAVRLEDVLEEACGKKPTNIGLLTLTFTCFHKENHYSQTISLPNTGINTDKLMDLEAFLDGFHEYASQYSVEQIHNILDKIDAKNEKILDLQRQLDMADLRASQAAQNAFISQGFANEVDALYNRLANCPVPSTPVYGRTPIFTCNNNGCGCGYNTTSQFI